MPPRCDSETLSSRPSSADQSTNPQSDPPSENPPLSFDYIKMNVVVNHENPLVRHKPFVAPPGKELLSPKMNSNGCNAEGSPRPNACLQCLKALSEAEIKLAFGRGLTFHLEVFSCLIHKSYGRGGNRCARCIGLGLKCDDVPGGFIEDAHSIIAGLHNYNRAVQVPPEDRNETHRKSLEDTNALATAFSKGVKSFAKGMRLSTSDGTPTKKRKRAWDDEPQNAVNQPGTKTGLERMQRNMEGLFSAMDTDIDRLYQQGEYIRSTMETDSDKLQKQMEQLISVMEATYKEALTASRRSLVALKSISRIERAWKKTFKMEDADADTDNE